MAKCPACGNEFEDVCKACNPDSQEEAANEPESRGDSPAAGETGGAVLLTTVGDNFEASLIETRLKQSGIPVMLKYRESGAYLSFYMGKTSFGVDIYVPAELLEDAKLLISPPDDSADSAEEPAGETGESAEESFESAEESFESVDESQEGVDESQEGVDESLKGVDESLKGADKSLGSADESSESVDESLKSAGEEYRKRIEFRSLLVFIAIIVVILTILAIEFIPK